MEQVKAQHLKTPDRVKGMSDKFYADLLHAPEQGKKVAWCIGPVPFIPLRAMDIPFVHMENYGARVSARRVAPFFYKVAEDWGLSKEACSYLRACQGMSLCFAQNVALPPELEQYRLPRPDMVICINYCISAVNLAEIFHRELKVPTFIIDTPYHYRDDHDRDADIYVPYLAQNLREFIAFLEEQMGRKMDYDRLGELTGNLKDMAIVRAEVLGMSKNIPAPLTIFDGLISLGAGNIWAGTVEAVDYYKALKVEVEERVANKVAAVSGERYRLLWDYIAVWARIGHLAKLFASHQAAVVFSLYTQFMQAYYPEILDPRNPVESLAKDMILGIIPYGHINDKTRYLTKAVEEYSIDGIIAHSPRTCRKIAMTQPLYIEQVTHKTGVPALTFEADHSDPDFYSEAEIDLRIIAFLEMLEARKRRESRG